MKTITIAIALFFTTACQLYAQTLNAPLSTTLLCPDEEYEYKVALATGTICGVTWSLSGSYELASGSLTSNPVKIKWKGTRLTTSWVCRYIQINVY